MQAFQVFNPGEDVGKYQQLEIPQVLDKINTVKKGFLIQKINEARRSGDTFRQTKWLTELGDADLDREDYETALQSYNEILSLDENSKEAISHRGNAYRRMGNYPAALTDFNRALELDPDDAWALAERGAMHWRLGDYPAALADLNRALELDPDNDWTHYSRGLILSLDNHPEQAQIDFSLAIQQSSQVQEQNPENWQNTFNLAIYHLAAGHIAEAESLYRNALMHSIPAGFLRAAINDLNDLLHCLPDHPRAKAIRDVRDQLQPRLDEIASC